MVGELQRDAPVGSSSTVLEEFNYSTFSYSHNADSVIKLKLNIITENSDNI